MLRSAMHREEKAVIGAETRKSLRKKLKAETTVEQESCETAAPPSCPSSYHLFRDPTDIVSFQKRLLDWYHKEKRALPWRTLAMTESNLNIRTYAVWVSEIMLQQTQVAIVINYYKKWMKRWPTVQDLATATLEEVNQMWAGLGYYSRGKRLHEGAQKVMSELKGEMPRTVEALQKQLPGVGRYTAGAIGSIALGQVTGAVDGNVIRVLCRVRVIGADSTSPAVTEALWSIANTLVDPERPGDFNQALMELGARVCTPKGPLCSKCPIQTHCHSYRKVQIQQEENSKRLLRKLECAALPDIEDCIESGECKLCPEKPWDSELGVQNFPRKPVKKAPREERTLTFVVAWPGEGEQEQFLLTQRPNKGLLAGMWEFPSLLIETENSERKQKGALCADVGRMLGLKLSMASIQHVGDVIHIFSHIHQTYVVYSICLKDVGVGVKLESKSTRWLTRSALQEAAVSTGVKKIIKLYDSWGTPKGQHTMAGKRNRTSGVKNEKQPLTKKSKLSASKSGTKQLSLSSYFKTAPS